MCDESKISPNEGRLKERIDYIKYKVMWQAFSAGQDYALEYGRCMDKDCKLSHDKDMELTAKCETAIDTLKQIADVIWDDNFDDESDEICACDECQESQETEQSIEPKISLN